MYSHSQLNPHGHNALSSKNLYLLPMVNYNKKRAENAPFGVNLQIKYTTLSNSESARWVCGLPVMTSVTSFTLSSVHLMRAARTFLRRRDTTVVMGTRMIVTVSPANAGKT